MAILIDSPAWSLLFRRDRNPRSGDERAFQLGVRDIVASGQALLIGAIRQEVLSGFRSEARFLEFRDHLLAFSDEPVLMADYETAALFWNRTWAAGIAPTSTDMLVCAVSARLRAPVLTADLDFERYARVLPVELHALSSR